MRMGNLLAEFESDELRATLAEARARVVETDAEIRLAELNRDRRQKLVEERILTQNDFDQATRDLDVARAHKVTAQATVDRYLAQLRKSRLVAPIAGHVTARTVDAGQTLESGDHAFTIADLARLRIEGHHHGRWLPRPGLEGPRRHHGRAADRPAGPERFQVTRHSSGESAPPATS